MEEVLQRRSVGEILMSLNQDLDNLGACDPSSLSEPGVIVAFNDLANRLEGLQTKAVAEFDAARRWAPDGAKSCLPWLITRCHLPKAQARRLVDRGKALAHLPIATEAFLAGDIGSAQFDALMRVRTPVTEAALAHDEDLLVGYAKEMKFKTFGTRLAYWYQWVDSGGADETDLERKTRRSVTATDSASGMVVGAFTLDPVGGSIFADELFRLEELLFKADWAEAKERLGREPKLGELARTSAQRRADALVEMATRSKNAVDEGGRPQAHFSVLVGYETLYGRICQLANGTVISPGSLLEWMDGATFERIVFAPGTRIECSPTSRFFSGATRRAIEVRDLECTHEYCDLPAERCQIDHIVPWNDDGPTTQENGRVHCGFHNRLRNHGPPEFERHGPEPGD